MMQNKNKRLGERFAWRNNRLKRSFRASIVSRKFFLHGRSEKSARVQVPSIGWAKR